MSTILVTQATGRQAQWVITELLDAGFKIHAIVRDPSKELPAVLKKPGVTIFKGDGTDLDATYEAAKGCSATFLNTYNMPPSYEQLQARTIVAATQKAGIKQIVASTSVGAGDKTLWDNEYTKTVGLHPYYTSKSGIEDMVRTATGIDTYTILRPAFIHWDYLDPAVQYNMAELATLGEYRHMLDPGTQFPHTDGRDVGRYACAALQDPARFAGAEIELYDHGLTAAQAAAIIGRVAGREIPVVHREGQDAAEFFKSSPGQVFHLWANGQDLTARFANGKENAAKFGIPFLTLEESLTREKESLLATLPDKA